MARIEISGLLEEIGSMAKLAEIPDRVIDGMLNAQSEVVINAQKRTGLRMGVHRTGVTLGSIKAGKIKHGKDGAYVDVYPQGKNADGNRNAEVGFINEYGKRGQAARPFINTANEESVGETTEAAANILHDWQESQ